MQSNFHMRVFFESTRRVGLVAYWTLHRQQDRVLPNEPQNVRSSVTNHGQHVPSTWVQGPESGDRRPTGLESPASSAPSLINNPWRDSPCPSGGFYTCYFPTPGSHFPFTFPRHSCLPFPVAVTIFTLMKCSCGQVLTFSLAPALITWEIHVQIQI